MLILKAVLHVIGIDIQSGMPGLCRHVQVISESTSCMHRQRATAATKNYTEPLKQNQKKNIICAKHKHPLQKDWLHHEYEELPTGKQILCA